jgi:hypothetical protein
MLVRYLTEEVGEFQLLLVLSAASLHRIPLIFYCKQNTPQDQDLQQKQKLSIK